MKSDVIDLELVCHHTTERAILVSTTGDKTEAEWLPLSQVEVLMTGSRTCTVTLPEWLAIEKGLV